MFGLRVVPLLRHPRCHTASPVWPPRDCFRSGITLTKELDCGKYFWLPSMMRWDNTERARFILLNGSNLQIQWQNLRMVIHPLITGLIHPISDELQDFSTQFRQIPHLPWISIKNYPDLCESGPIDRIFATNVPSKKFRDSSLRLRDLCDLPRGRSSPWRYLCDLMLMDRSLRAFENWGFPKMVGFPKNHGFSY